ncbi:MAG: T9SS type A sorting domain-containing protein [Bacteroidetes bacterium]|nr:T9SS type A sorting domain-containing protein [Bacteroidota bacterium]
MKKILSIIAIATANFCAAQITGGQFAPTNSQWLQESDIWQNPPPHLVTTYYQFILKNDTVINGKNYGRLYSSNTHLLDSSLSCYSFWNFIYYDSNKVYIGNNPDSMKLTFDFNLAKGDSFIFYTKYCLSQPSYKCAIDSVDTITLGSKQRKRIFFSAFYNNVQPHITWVEGVGDMRYGWYTDYGCLTYLVGFGDSFYLDCFTDNTQTTFGTCSYGSCSAGVEESNLNRELRIFPNPSNGIFVIQKGWKEINTIKVFNLLGERIYFASINSETTTIDLSNQKDGIYFVQIKTEDGTASKKIIIQH